MKELAGFEAGQFKYIHVTRAPFFNGSLQEPRLGTGGVEVAVGTGTRYDTDLTFTLANGAAEKTRNWAVSEVDKRTIVDFPELSSLPEPIRGVIAEQHVSASEYEGFRNWSIAMWWIHHGMNEPFSNDTTNAMPNGNFLPSHTAHRVISAAAAEAIKNSPVPQEAVVVQDPYYYPWIGNFLKNLHHYPARVVGVNHIPFPKPEHFAFLAEVNPNHWEKLARAYMNAWLQFDAISFHSTGDIDRFMACAEEYTSGSRLPELFVNPLGIDIDTTNATVETVTASDSQRLLGIITDHAPFLDTSDQLQGKVIGMSIGNRSDPIKRFPVTISAVEILLDQFPELLGQFTYVQQMRPHRIDDFASYAREYQEIHARVTAVNNRFAHQGWQPIILVDQKLTHEEVIKTQHVLSGLARDCFTVVASVEGMNIAGQEAFFASQRSDFGLIATNGSGLGATLLQNGAGELVVPRRYASPEQVAGAVSRFLESDQNQKRGINHATRQVLLGLEPSQWLHRVTKRN